MRSQETQPVLSAYQRGKDLQARILAGAMLIINLVYVSASSYLVISGLIPIVPFAIVCGVSVLFMAAVVRQAFGPWDGRARILSRVVLGLQFIVAILLTVATLAGFLIVLAAGATVSTLGPDTSRVAIVFAFAAYQLIAAKCIHYLVWGKYRLARV